LRPGGGGRPASVAPHPAGKPLGVGGLGGAGRGLPRRAAGLDMKVVGFDPFLAPDRAAQLGIESVAGLGELLPRCDFLTVHTPLTDETRNLIGAAQLAQLRKGARVLNCARGGIINEEALAEALGSGHVAGAAVDVFVEEPPPADHPLLQLPNVVVTPHLGASTVEAQTSVAIEAAQLLIDFLTRGVVQFAVNMAAVDRTELEELRHYIDLARRLGLLQAQMAQGAVRRAGAALPRGAGGRHTPLLPPPRRAGPLR